MEHFVVSELHSARERNFNRIGMEVRCDEIKWRNNVSRSRGVWSKAINQNDLLVLWSFSSTHACGWWRVQIECFSILENGDLLLLRHGITSGKSTTVGWQKWKIKYVESTSTLRSNRSSPNWLCSQFLSRCVDIGKLRVCGMCPLHSLRPMHSVSNRSLV